jgi:hypothetical protein
MRSRWLRPWATMLRLTFSGASLGSGHDCPPATSTVVPVVSALILASLVRKTGQCANSIQLSTWRYPANATMLPCAFGHKR